MSKTMRSGKLAPLLRRRTTHTTLADHEGGFVEKYSAAQPALFLSGLRIRAKGLR